MTYIGENLLEVLLFGHRYVEILSQESRGTQQHFKNYLKDSMDIGQHTC